MEEKKEISSDEKPFEGNINCNSETIDPLDHIQREKRLVSVLYKRFGITLLILSGIIIPLLITSFFYHPGLNDQVALLIEQIIGFILSGIGIILGAFLLLISKRKKTDQDLIYEKLENQKEED
ncbi:MAG: hypothetical protein ACFFDW_04710 [Candidatus Thorarchaeota archaeon]